MRSWQDVLSAQGGRIRWAIGLVVAAVVANRVDGQIIRRPARPAEPQWWVTFNAGYSRSRTIQDGSTQSDWAFGSGPQYGGSIEKTVSPGTTVGISGFFSQLPLSYRPFGTLGPANCPGSCEATANVTEVMGLFRAGYGGAYSFRAAHEFGIGVTAYSNFRDQATGGTLPPSKTDLDFLLAYSSLFGFGLSPTTSLEFGFGTGFTIHQREGLAANENTLNPILRLRLGLRLGVGQ